MALTSAYRRSRRLPTGADATALDYPDRWPVLVPATADAGARTVLRLGRTSASGSRAPRAVSASRAAWSAGRPPPNTPVRRGRGRRTWSATGPAQAWITGIRPTECSAATALLHRPSGPTECAGGPAQPRSDVTVAQAARAAAADPPAARRADRFRPTRHGALRCPQCRTCAAARGSGVDHIERIVTGWTPTGRLPSHKPAGPAIPQRGGRTAREQVPPQRHDDHLGRERNPATTEQGVRTSHELWCQAAASTPSRAAGHDGRCAAGCFWPTRACRTRRGRRPGRRTGRRGAGGAGPDGRGPAGPCRSVVAAA